LGSANKSANILKLFARFSEISSVSCDHVWPNLCRSAQSDLERKLESLSLCKSLIYLWIFCCSLVSISWRGISPFGAEDDEDSAALRDVGWRKTAF